MTPTCSDPLMFVPMKALIIYHADCTDGACAAWAARYHCERAGYDCTLVPAEPGRCPDEAFARAWDLVLAVDMCPPADAIGKLAQSASVHVLDHHRTNREAVATCRGIYDETRSGAGLAWDEVPAIVGVPAMPRPWFVDYIEDRDLWRFALPGSKAVNAALSFGQRTVERIQEIAATDTAAAFHEGERILKFQAETVAQVCKHAIVTTRFSFACSAVEQSEIGAALVAAHGLPACIWYTRDTDSGPVAQVSFRSRDGLADVSEVAARLGGGGHRNAAGAVVPLARWFYELCRWLDFLPDVWGAP